MLTGSATGHSLRVVPNARGPAPSAALRCPPCLGAGLPGKRTAKFPRRESERPQDGETRQRGAEREARRSDRLEAEPPLPPCLGPEGGGPGPEHAPRSPPSQRPRATLQDLALQSKRPDRQAPPKPTRIPVPQGVICLSLQGLPAPRRPHARHRRLGPPSGPLSPARHAPPGPSASSALAPRAPASRIRTRTQPPGAAVPSRDSPALGL